MLRYFVVTQALGACVDAPVYKRYFEASSPAFAAQAAVDEMRLAVCRGCQYVWVFADAKAYYDCLAPIFSLSDEEAS